jgi:hypothetical protein
MKPESRSGPERDAMDATDQFKAILLDQNNLTRSSSVKYRKSVKELYKDWFESGKVFIDWWTALLKEAEMIDEIELTLEERKRRKWSEVASSLIHETTAKAMSFAENGAAALEAKAKALNNTRTYTEVFEPVLKSAESLQSTIPWYGPPTNSFSSDGLVWLTRQANFEGDIALLDMEVDHSSPKSLSFIFVCPALFRSKNQEVIGLFDKSTICYQFSVSTKRRLSCY